MNWYDYAPQVGIILTYSIGIILALHAIYNARSSEGALAWVLALIFLPFISIFFYLGLGTKRLERLILQTLPESSVNRLTSLWTAFPAKTGQEELSIAKLTGISPCSGNNLQLLRNGEETYGSLLEAIEEAQESIELEFFIIKNDLVGNILAELLIKKAGEGLRVKVLYDEIGSHKLPLGFIRRLRKAGVDIHPFFGRRFWVSSFLRINYRNHRKLVIVDHKQAWLGGLNIGNEYIEQMTDLHWRDTFMKLEGPAAAQAFLCFAQDWYRATNDDICAHYPSSIRSAGEQQAMCIPSGPENYVNAWQATLLILAASAKKRLWIATPYLVPSTAVVQALHIAALRGVDVRLIIPQKDNNFISGLAMLNYIPEFLSYGVRIWGYEAGFMHQKVLLCDDELSCIGSANLDNRSLNLNYELNCLMRDPAMNAAVSDMLLADMERSKLLTKAIWTEASVFKKLGARACRLLAPVL